jgi:methyl-accepting chemotaxis protein
LQTQFTALGLSPAENEIVSNVGALHAQTKDSFKEALGQALAFNTEGALKILLTKIDPVNQQTFLEINKLVSLQKQATTAVIDNSIADDQRLTLFLLIVDVTALFIGVVFAWFLTRSITLPLRSASAIAKTVASGVLTSKLTVSGKDEISELLAALSEMNSSLIRTVSGVRMSTEAITGASQEIAIGNADLSSRTESQAGSLEETASTMEQLTDIVKETQI